MPSSNPSVLAATPTLCGSVSFQGLRAYNAGYAVDNDRNGVVYLSLIGYRTAVRAVWAALMDGDAIEIGRKLFRRLDGNYVTRTTRLPDAARGVDHMVILHHQATVPHLQMGEAFYVINDTGKTPPYARFLAALDRATAAPLLPAWSKLLWENGRRNKLILPLETAKGIKAWWVSADDEMWLALIQKGIAKNKLPCAADALPESPDAEVNTEDSDASQAVDVADEEEDE